MTQKYQALLLVLLLAAKHVNQMPISVPVDTFSDVIARYPNAHFNRLPGNRYPFQSDPLVNNNNNNNVNSVTDEYEDYDDQTSNKPSSQYTSSNNYNSNYSPLLTESFIKHKRRRRKKIRRPCIPIQSFNSPLYSKKRYRREVEGKDSGKTLGFLFGNPFAYPPPIGTPFYGNYYPGGGTRPPYDNTNPQNDVQNAPLYNPVGGYPCIPVSYGHPPFGSGPFGFFGPGGLFDSGVSPSISVPQTVVVNRPPLFGNRPPYYGQGDQSNGSNDGSPPGFWGSVVDKLSEFVTSVSPQAVYSAIGDTLQGIGNAIQNAQPATAAVDTIRNGYREFSSLIFR